MWRFIASWKVRGNTHSLFPLPIVADVSAVSSHGGSPLSQSINSLVQALQPVTNCRHCHMCRGVSVIFSTQKCISRISSFNSILFLSDLLGGGELTDLSYGFNYFYSPCISFYVYWLVEKGKVCLISLQCFPCCHTEHQLLSLLSARTLSQNEEVLHWQTSHTAHHLVALKFPRPQGCLTSWHP